MQARRKPKNEFLPFMKFGLILNLSQQHFVTFTLLHSRRVAQRLMNMIQFLKGRALTNFSFVAGSALFVFHIFFREDVRTKIPFYDLLRIILMATIVFIIFFNKPFLGFWIIALFGLLLLRFFAGEFLESIWSWYGAASFLATGLVVFIVIIKEFHSLFK